MTVLRAGVFGSSHVSATSYRAAVLADSPFCYFPLNDASTPTDVMGNVTPSSVTGVTLGVSGIGDGSTAASFDGGATGRGIALPYASMPAPASITALTVEIIAKATDMTAQRAMFGQEQTALLRHTASAGVDPFTGSGWANRIGAASYSEASPTAIHHWAITWDGSNANLYRDGVSVLSEAQSTAFGNAGTPLFYIGCRGLTDITFLGTLAGFAYYTTALSSTRVFAHAHAAGVA